MTVAAKPWRPGIAASLWSVPASERLDEARRLIDGGIDQFHWDFSDGSFAAPGGAPAPQAREIAEATGTLAETHLMVTDPLRHLDDWIPFCGLIAVHLEVPDCLEALERIRAAGRKTAVAISPDTPIPDPLPDAVDAVLIMSVAPGMGGSSFRPDAFARIAQVSTRAIAGVDGGVTAELAREAYVSGAQWIVVGTSLLRAPSVSGWITTATA